MCYILNKKRFPSRLLAGPKFQNSFTISSPKIVIMKLFALIAVCSVTLAVTSCSSGGGKKVVIMSSGKMHVDEKDHKTIVFEPGNQHNDLELTLGADDKTVLVKTSSGEKTYDIPENALYLLNLKSDTVIGNIVNYGSSGIPASISSEALQHMIDSTQQLLVGANASDEKKTFFLVPNSIKKISTNLNATILSPYKGIPYEVKVDDKGNAPEMYKFFTNKQKREALNELLERLKK